MSGGESESARPLRMVGRSAGVLGHAEKGVGVFGHGGPLMSWGGPPDTLPSPVPWVVGGFFSAGWRSTEKVPPTTQPQIVSLSSLAQIQLLPSNNQKLPTQAQLGSIYFVMAKHGSEAEKPTVGYLGQLWICTETYQCGSLCCLAPSSRGAVKFRRMFIHPDAGLFRSRMSRIRLHPQI
jgi:hypothetical protein